MSFRVITLSYSREVGRFVDDELRQLTDRYPLVSSQHYLIEADGSPRLVFVLELRWDAAARPASTRTDPGGAACPEDLVVARHAPPPAPRTPGGQLDLSQLTPPEQATFQELRRWRSEQAHEQGVPPFVVLTNRHLLELIARRPGSATALGRIHGIGKAKVERYGPALLQILARNGSRGLEEQRCEAEADGADLAAKPLSEGRVAVSFRQACATWE